MLPSSQHPAYRIFATGSASLQDLVDTINSQVKYRQCIFGLDVARAISEILSREENAPIRLQGDRVVLVGGGDQQAEPATNTPSGGTDVQTAADRPTDDDGDDYDELYDLSDNDKKSKKRTERSCLQGAADLSARRHSLPVQYGFPKSSIFLRTQHECLQEPQTSLLVGTRCWGVMETERRMTVRPDGYTVLFTCPVFGDDPRYYNLDAARATYGLLFESEYEWEAVAAAFGEYDTKAPYVYMIIEDTGPDEELMAAMLADEEAALEAAVDEAAGLGEQMELQRDADLVLGQDGDEVVGKRGDEVMGEEEDEVVSEDEDEVTGKSRDAGADYHIRDSIDCAPRGTLRLP
ncbi:hypothetical protein B0A55_10960 [Friedmanniomyces simplex]|uniref:Uncharacterized protein n=1 Tax=Friedmanniomyces simplex TaxID=329884 RepID=A0A4V5NDW9_9PEZI|nr:hypothetical protein B0A55_10960 [Friedmanniomyces simplex]